MSVDLYNTNGCPVGHRCESCGVEGSDLAVETSTSGLGVMCLTLCGHCASFDDAIRVAVSTAVRLVLQHCEHLGIDVDQMAAELARGDR